MKISRWLKNLGRKKPPATTAESDGAGISEVHRVETYRLRIESCIETILEVNESLSDSLLDPETIDHFERLKTVMQNLDARTIQEKDLVRLEEATNRLLQDMKSLGSKTRSPSPPPADQPVN